MMLCDCECKKCGAVYTDKILFNDEVVMCENCGSECERIQCLNASFRLKYNNKTDKCAWGNEGYAASQYHTATKKMCKNNIFVGGTKKSESTK